MNLKKIILLMFLFSFFTKVNSNTNQLAYDFSFKIIDGGIIELSKYKNKVIVVTNVASRCGFTNQYTDLQKLRDKYSKDDLIIIGVPSNSFKQEPASNKEIKDFCETNFGITFPITEKNNIIGKNAHPFFIWAKESFGKSAIPKWNFHKIIINKRGNIVNTFTSLTNPMSKKFIAAIDKEVIN